MQVLYSLRKAVAERQPTSTPFKAGGDGARQPRGQQVQGGRVTSRATAMKTRLDDKELLFTSYTILHRL